AGPNAPAPPWCAATGNGSTRCRWESARDRAPARAVRGAPAASPATRRRSARRRRSRRRAPRWAPRSAQQRLEVGIALVHRLLVGLAPADPLQVTEDRRIGRQTERQEEAHGRERKS